LKIEVCPMWYALTMPWIYKRNDEDMVWG
jgi:hypothetical protein